MRIPIYPILLFVSLASLPTSDAHASAGGAITKAITKFLFKEGGQEATEQAVKKMTKEVGEQLIERTAQKVLREGGEKSLLEVGELVAKHGPDVIRALDNAPDALPVLKLLNELPADEVAKAASRLAAGSTGKELATLSTKLGTSVLSAEARHPGVGMVFARALGNEGSELSLKLTTNQAIQIGRHVDDIAALPAAQQSQLISLISSNADRFSVFVGRFVKANPGKVLFTAASVPIIVANSSAFFGDGELVFDAAGNPILDSKGNPVRHHSGIVPQAAKDVGDTLKQPVQNTLYWVGGVIVVLVSLLGSSKVWKHYQKDKLELEAARNEATTNSKKKRRTEQHRNSN